MEDEFKIICSELAKSIARESDLEAVVRRLQEHIVGLQVSSKRSSKSSLDSGYSSETFSEYNQRSEEIERIQRESAVEKASISLSLSAKLHDEKLKRVALEKQIEKLNTKNHQMLFTSTGSPDDMKRIESLESACVDLKRRLSEEKESSSNFQSLFLALQSELRQVCVERDNVRNNDTPELNINSKLRRAEVGSYISKKERSYQEPSRHIVQDALGRDGHYVARSNNSTVGWLITKPSGSFNTVNKFGDSTRTAHLTREGLTKLLEDVEAQRDALHSALKSLLGRQEIRRDVNHRTIDRSEIHYL